MHENYSRPDSRRFEVQFNDIGLIRVSEPIDFNDRVDKIDLQAKEFNEHRISAVLTGWGETEVKLLLHLTYKHSY